MQYLGTVVGQSGNKAVVRYKPRASGCGGWGSGEMSQDEMMREVTAVNTVDAQIGDEVQFDLPDMIDVFTMYRHLLWPFIIGLVVAFVVRLALQSTLRQLSGQMLGIVTLLTVLFSFFIALKVLTKHGVIKRDTMRYTIEITSVVTRAAAKFKTL